MALVGRIFVILFALWLATMAAGIVWSIGLLGQQWASSGDPGEQIVFWGTAFLASGMTAAFIFMPTLIAVALAEAFSVRSLLLYAASGGALMLLAHQGASLGRYEESIDKVPPAIARETEIAAAAGVAFGLVYWLIAGRKAGVWKK